MASSSSMATPSEEDLALLTKLMSDGKRNYICNQPQIALECFVELCEKLATFYGQESDKCVEAYLYYGKTLLEIGRLENGVLGHAIKEAPVFGTADEGTEEAEVANEKDKNTEDEEDITPEKRVEIRNHVENAMRDENLYNASSTEDDQTEGEDTEAETVDEDKKNEDTETSADKEVTEEASTTTTETDASSAEKPTTTSDVTSSTATEAEATNGEMEVDDGIHSDGSDIGDEDEEDVSNMELSWEMFELTTVICKRQLQEKERDAKAVKSVLAEAKYGLAQVSLETERYEEAVKDFMECLDLYKEILDDQNDRRIAEAHYNIALANSFDKKYTEAIEQFEFAVKILKAKVEDLEGKVKESEEKGSKTEKVTEQVEDWKKEILELNDLIVLDMMAKIEDAHESKKLLDESIEKVKNAAGEIFEALGGQVGQKNEFDAGFDEGFDAPLKVDTKVVHDISDKIRSSKRKNEDETSTTVEKKIKQMEPVPEELAPVPEE